MLSTFTQLRNTSSISFSTACTDYRGAEADNLYDGCQHRQSETRVTITCKPIQILFINCSRQKTNNATRAYVYVVTKNQLIN